MPLSIKNDDVNGRKSSALSLDILTL